MLTAKVYRVTRYALLVALFTSFATSSAQATIVRFDTVLGPVDVRLYTEATPLTVQNFLNYMNDGDWNGTFFHRSAANIVEEVNEETGETEIRQIPFVVQGGGFTFGNRISSVVTDDPVQNEPGISNLRGTIAVAKLSGDPDSGTSQWFFNLGDNSENLDNQNEGFTVFGRVVGNGMDVVDAIAALQRVNAGSPFDNLPVRNWNPGDPIELQNVVTVNTIFEVTNTPGDYNFNGLVDSDDLAVLDGSFGSALDAEADGNGNGLVDLGDLNLLGANFVQPVAQSALALATAGVPEPTSVLLLATGAVALFARRRSAR